MIFRCFLCWIFFFSSFPLLAFGSVLVDEDLSFSNSALLKEYSDASLIEQRIVGYEVALDEALQRIDQDDYSEAKYFLQKRAFIAPVRFTQLEGDVFSIFDQYNDPSQKGVLYQKVKNQLLATYKSLLLTARDDYQRFFEKGLVESASVSQKKIEGYSRLIKRFIDEEGHEAFLQCESLQLSVDVSSCLESISVIQLSEADKVQKINQLYIFLDLINKEYARGVRGKKVTVPFELQEALSFAKAAKSNVRDLAPYFQEESQKIDVFVEAMSALQAELSSAIVSKNARPQAEFIDDVSYHTAQIQIVFPQNKEVLSLETDFILVEETLKILMQAVANQDFEQAELLRIQAYGFFDANIEIRLLAYAPNKVKNIEELFWNGSANIMGLGSLVAIKAPLNQFAQTNSVLRKSLEETKILLVDKNVSSFRIISNAAVIVFREGFEAIIIIFGMSASTLMLSRKGRRKKEDILKPLRLGMLSAIALTVLSAYFMYYFLSFFQVYGERVEAIVSLIAVAVLLVIMNWFFRDIYWHQWSDSLRSKNKKAIDAGSGVFQGLFLVGFTSIMREGFEVALFLQVLLLDAGFSLVLQGVLLGLSLLSLVAIAMFYLRKMLPMMKLLMISLVLMWLVLLVMIGQTVHLMQVVGWMAINPLHMYFPFWLGQWFGIYPNIQGLLIQAIAFVFVVGSFVAAEYLRQSKKNKARFINAL